MAYLFVIITLVNLPLLPRFIASPLYVPLTLLPSRVYVSPLVFTSVSTLLMPDVVSYTILMFSRFILLNPIGLVAWNPMRYSPSSDTAYLTFKF